MVAIQLGFVVGCFAFSMTEMFKPGELLGGHGRAVNHLIHGRPTSPDPATLTGWRLFAWKYTFCPMCLAGAAGLCVALANDISSHFFLPFVAMATAKTLSSWSNH